MAKTDIERIRELLPKARAAAAKNGSMDTLWDVIADGEALLAGRPTLANTDAPQIRRWLEDRVAPV